jgi:hypothetical protein
VATPPVKQQDQSTTEAFQHKQDCAQYIATAKQQLSQYDADNSFPGWTRASSLGRVFYSSSQNSCLYTSVTATYNDKNEHLSDRFALYDVLSGELIANVLATWGSPDYAHFQQEFDDALTRYE